MDEIMKDLELLTDVTELEKEIEGEENNEWCRKNIPNN